MSTTLARQLADAMNAATAGVRVPDGLLDTALKRHRRRVRAWQAGASVVVVLVAALALPRAAGPRSGHVTTLQPVTAAFVTREVQRALADNSTEIMKLTFTGPDTWRHYLYYDPVTGSGRTHATTADGTTVGDDYSSRVGDQYTDVAVDYQQRNWSKVTETLPSTSQPNPLPQTAQQIQVALAHGAVSLVDRTSVDGHSVIKLAVSSTALPPNTTITLWVDSATYRLIRDETISGTPPARVITDYAWLPRTAANLALFDLHIPAGFSQQPFPYAPGTAAP